VRWALEQTPEGRPERSRLLYLLGEVLRIRYERAGNLQDLEAAIGFSEAAVDIAPEDHPDRGGGVT